ncbi:ParB/RepB/Spo0J family partition protein [Pontibaca salina]|uniref:ParB N-terminal domain-containing protein n=1 Tax=Pontibaca salina TaxID=2795731 RepID=A0A934HRX4_9RHOB|nr:ParB N-terminal domain-containing protein [Pontibaca salina]MBI6630647.1 ParB N-terminal domain-containing protein [Pontibaca salina]
MAKRKRLTPAQPGAFSPAAKPAAALAPRSGLGPAPIAQVAGEAAASAALADLAEAIEEARSSGRLIEELPLDAIDPQYLMRDRLEQDEEELQALMASLRARGQQTAIEVVALDPPQAGKTYGLISGWRRLTALDRLYRATGEERFATVRAITTTPDSARAAYVAMVEENEIRVNLSFYERARIAIRAMHQEVYDSQRAALQGLFAATTRSKRSKIGSFIPVVEAFDSVLRHPTAISERLGLALSQALARDPEFRPRLRARLREVQPQTVEEELRLLNDALADPGRATPVAAPSRPRLRAPETPALAERVTAHPAPGLTLRFTQAQNRIELTGARVTPELYEALQDFLKANTASK